jgi:hypothetical protein
MPWRLYEKQCHYAGMSYLSHLWMNVEHAFTWTFRLEMITQEDVDFEKEVNPSWKDTFKTMFAGITS